MDCKTQMKLEYTHICKNCFAKIISCGYLLEPPHLGTYKLGLIPEIIIIM